MGIGANPIINNNVLVYLNDYWYIIATSIILSTPIIEKLKNISININPTVFKVNLWSVMHGLILIVCMIMVIVLLNSYSYNPFLYFRF